MARFEDLRDLRPKRLGVEVGAEGDLFYVAGPDGSIYELGAAAFYVWSMCDGERSVGDIVTTISEEAGIPRDDLEEPVSIIVEKLMEAGLLEGQR